MGRSSRLKTERRAARARLAARTPQQVDYDLLLDVNTAIGSLFGPLPRCVEAAAMLEHAGDLLGHPLTILPVAVRAHDTQTNVSLVMGPRATSALTAVETARLDRSLLPDGVDSGHLALVGGTPTPLFDPNIGQLAAYELPLLNAVALPIADPRDDAWSFTIGTLTVNYLRDDSNRYLLRNYDELAPEWQHQAELLLEVIRAGGSAQDFVNAQPPAP